MYIFPIYMTANYRFSEKAFRVSLIVKPNAIFIIIIYSHSNGTEWLFQNELFNNAVCNIMSAACNEKKIFNNNSWLK